MNAMKESTHVRAKPAQVGDETKLPEKKRKIKKPKKKNKTERKACERWPSLPSAVRYGRVRAKPDRAVSLL